MILFCFMWPKFPPTAIQVTMACLLTALSGIPLKENVKCYSLGLESQGVVMIQLKFTFCS